MISARHLDRLPDIRGLRRLLRSLAALDAILSPEWEHRYYSFDSRWGDGEQMASMRNGSGDHWFALFTAAGAGIVGLSHESPMFRPGHPLPGLFDGLPAALSALRTEPAFDSGNSTFCLWRLTEDAAWSRGTAEFAAGPDPDGSAELLALLDGDVDSYRRYAAEYFGHDLSAGAVASVYAHAPLSRDLVHALNPTASIEALSADLAEIGYPEPSDSPL